MKTNFDSKLRLDYIDQLKGLAILCIVLLHYEDGIFTEQFNIFIGMFMITAFYFTSGWLQGFSFKQQSVNELFLKRIRSIGIPYLWFVLLILLFDVIWIFCGYAEWKLLATHLYNAVILRGIGTLWFLPALFGGELIFAWLRNKNSLLLTLTAFVGTIIYLHYFNQWHQFRDLSDFNRIIDAPFHAISRVVYAWPIIGMGFLLSKFYKQQISSLSAFAQLLWGRGILVVLWISMSLGIGDFGPFFMNIFLPLGWMLVFVSLPKNPISRFLSFWGKNSLILMATHYSIIMEICIVINREWLGHPVFEGKNTLWFFIASILLEYPIVWLFNHKLKFMLGK